VGKEIVEVVGVNIGVMGVWEDICRCQSSEFGRSKIEGRRGHNQGIA